MYVRLTGRYIFPIPLALRKQSLKTLQMKSSNAVNSCYSTKSMKTQIKRTTNGFLEIVCKILFKSQTPSNIPIHIFLVRCNVSQTNYTFHYYFVVNLGLERQALDYIAQMLVSQRASTSFMHHKQLLIKVKVYGPVNNVYTCYVIVKLKYERIVKDHLLLGIRFLRHRPFSTALPNAISPAALW